MQTTYLSYYINDNTPGYGGEKAIFIKNKSAISDGASSNTKILQFPNHIGTHIDFPNHFSNSGKTINDYLPSFWKFKYVYVLPYNVKQNEVIDEFALRKFEIPHETEFLIIYTGFGNFRKTKVYWNNNPGLSPSLAKNLKSKCPNLRVVGFDFISLSSYQNRVLGRIAHKEFLIENDILIVEDMNLSGIQNRRIKSVTALPLQIDKIDGSPITIIADYE
jgi:arylformamidase